MEYALTAYEEHIMKKGERIGEKRGKELGKELGKEIGKEIGINEMIDALLRQGVPVETVVKASGRNLQYIEDRLRALSVSN